MFIIINIAKSPKNSSVLSPPGCDVFGCVCSSVGRPVCLFPSLFICVCNYSKSNQRIFMNIFMWLGPDQMTNGLRIGKDPDQILD